MKRFFVLMIMAAIFFFACGESQESLKSTPPGQQSSIDDVSRTPVVRFGGIRFSMPSRYLKEELVWKTLPATGLPAGNYAVVGSQKARLYAETPPKTMPDLAKIGAGTPIPIGTILQISTVYEEKSKEFDGLFKFENEYNNFYATSFGGKKGIVFGADLVFVQGDENKARKLSYYYTRPAKSDAFYAFNGTRDLSDIFQKRLVEDHVAFEPVMDKYYLSVDNPDDFIALYNQDVKERENCVFITTDIMVHSLHLVFDRLLQNVEEEYFFQNLKKLVDGFLKEVSVLEARDDRRNNTYTVSLAKTRVYFEVAQALLAMAPEREQSGREYGPVEWVYHETDKNAVMAGYGAMVQKELKLVMGAGGFAMSPNFIYNEDYSQYKPRGHYAKNGILEAYFRAMMWFGRIHLVFTDSARRTLTREEALSWGYNLSDDYKGGETALQVALVHTPVTLIVNKIARDNNELYKQWDALFSPITYLIGMSDDLSINDMKPLFGLVDWANFPAWVSDTKKLATFITEGHKKMRPPLIAGNSVFTAPAEENLAPSMGYRLFGQRFVFDSHIFHRHTAPRIGFERMPEGLDVMAVLGSKSAETLLFGNSSENNAWRSTYDDTKKIFDGFSNDFYNLTFYNQYLYMIRELARFERGAGFYFTDRSAWNYKSLISAHGAWAELRHDTILYVKQSYSEMSGGGMWEQTFRTIPFQRPVHYVEPNLNFFYGYQDAVSGIMKNLSQLNLMPEAYSLKLKSLLDLANKLTAIVELEIQDKAISTEQNEFILTVPEKLAQIVVPVSGAQGYTEKQDEFQMALIADVHTDAQHNMVLETAVGKPLRMFVALNDGQGGTRIATGYVYSYYEFAHPLSGETVVSQNPRVALPGGRLRDEDWKPVIYGNDQDRLTEVMPGWLSEFYQKKIAGNK
ncbi:MAG: DUF3160 domain-containing protein [Spirochaetaceae bacterium]|nr:MAG: DUF3160 domain-containing protein [Spirochaetaceae bacterium]